MKSLELAESSANGKSRVSRMLNQWVRELELGKMCDLRFFLVSPGHYLSRVLKAARWVKSKQKFIFIEPAMTL